MIIVACSLVIMTQIERERESFNGVVGGGDPFLFSSPPSPVERIIITEATPARRLITCLFQHLPHKFFYFYFLQRRILLFQKSYHLECAFLKINK
jgi:hypothetical protein